MVVACLVTLWVSETCGGEVILPSSAQWEYLHPTDGIDPATMDVDFATTWHTPSVYDGPDFSRPEPAMLAYGSIGGQSVETILETPPSGSRYTSYFRTSITTERDFESFAFEILADDGGVLYINGERVTSINYSGEDHYTGIADTSADEDVPIVVLLEHPLEAGTHTIAFSLHNLSPTSSDLGFSMQIEAEPSSLEFMRWRIEDSGEVIIRRADMNVRGRLVIPPEIEGLPVTGIQHTAFQNGLWTTIVLPKTLTEIGNRAFRGCNQLREVTLPEKVSEIGEEAFESCSQLEEITLPDGLQIVRRDTFFQCASLRKVVIPDSVTSIDRRAFSQCTSLSDLILPNRLTSIGSSAFSSCFSLSHVRLPNGLKNIASSTFSNCSSLAEVTIPISVETIEASAFRQCAQLSHVDLPERLKSIRGEAFRACSSLTEVLLPGSVDDLGDRVFMDCSNLKHVTLSPGTPFISEMMFTGCISLENAVVPDGVEFIGRSAFKGCTSLARVTIPGSVETIGDSAFSNCEALENLDIAEGVQSIGAVAFSACTKLVSVTIPDSIATIGRNAFYQCMNLVTVHLGSGLRSVGSNAFSGTAIQFFEENNLKYLTSTVSAFLVDGSIASGHVVIPSELSSLPVRSINAFRDNTMITSIMIPDSVTRIGESALSGCRALAYAAVSASVKEIEPFAFNNTVSLREIAFYGEAPEVSGAFSRLPIGAKVYVSANHLDSYGGLGSEWHGLTVTGFPTEVTRIRRNRDHISIFFSGEPAASSWQIRGSASLSTFVDDLTSTSTIEETSPGDYSAVINAKDLPPTYFLRVEK